MNKYILLMQPEFLKRASNLSKEAKNKLLRVLWLLSEDYRHPGLQTKKVQGTKNSVFECRVDQAIRLIYDLEGVNLRCWYVGEHDAALHFATSPQMARKSVSGTEHTSDDIEIVLLGADEQELVHYLAHGVTPLRFIEFPELLRSEWGGGE
jgi:mRNA-degrading endonuclease YafQ of YafQ-DinJ toxin-antitoxin module